MRLATLLPGLFTLCLLLGAAEPPAMAGAGSLSYRARVVHNNRSAISYVEGRVDFATGDFEEHVTKSYELDWKQLPGRMLPTRPILPSIWRSNGHSAQQLADTLPRFDSPLLRHFILGRVLAQPSTIVKDAQFLNGQLVIGSTDFGEYGFEIVASFRGMPLVLVGRRDRESGTQALRELVVLGPSSELYQYFFEQLEFRPEPLSPQPQLPRLDHDNYVTFPRNGGTPVAIRPVKDWLVFQAELPSGRQLNLLFDSAAEQMIVDDMVLKLDSNLRPAGEISVSGPAGDQQMQLYEGFGFTVGGVEFKNLSVAGTALTRLGYGAELRIHGVIGNEMLQLCKLDLDLASGQLRLAPPGSAMPELSAPGVQAEQLPLTFIRELPHIEGAVQDQSRALLLLDTGQRSPLSVNLDYLEHHNLGDELKMNGFLGDITGGLLPRYIVEELPLSLAGATYTEKAVDASEESTFSYGGVPVVGAIGFPLLARHFGGITFDYSRKLMWLRDPAEHREFVGQPDAWTIRQPATSSLASLRALDKDADEIADSLQLRQRPAASGRSQLGLDPGGYDSENQAHASNPNTPARAEELREEARARKAERETPSDADQPAAEEPAAEEAPGTETEGGEPQVEPSINTADEPSAATGESDDKEKDNTPPFRLKPSSSGLKRS